MKLLFSDLYAKRVAKLITFLFPAKFYRFFFAQTYSLSKDSLRMNIFKLCLSLKAGAKIITVSKTTKQKSKKI